jgi:FkbM family methyltransferase
VVIDQVYPIGVMPSPGRHTIVANAAHFVVRGLKARFRDEKAELRAIREHVASTDIVCDIGANKGSFTFWLARWCRNGRVIAFEPQAEIAGRLASDCRTLNFSNVTVEPIGVYSKSGIQQLYVPRDHSPGATMNMTVAVQAGFTSVPVPVVSLDDYFSEDKRISLLKIDVEGSERHVLLGAERILRTFYPLLVFECENRHLRDEGVNDVFRYLISIGYLGSFVCRGRLLPISKFDAAVHQREDREWFWKSKDYCNNFVFAKA